MQTTQPRAGKRIVDVGVDIAEVVKTLEVACNECGVPTMEVSDRSLLFS